jgi:hypothetical protein
MQKVASKFEGENGIRKKISIKLNEWTKGSGRMWIHCNVFFGPEMLVQKICNPEKGLHLFPSPVRLTEAVAEPWKEDDMGSWHHCNVCTE